ncbi:hypothetical protein BDW59DRAFT_182130 [Aspergillus cavernicola]|uniref:FAD/NAD(P)-binding domain-containing protein n=1 Tax=Aspergillus cavernicola TaxID=176166 RepID=A0ABR4IX87_9EURO
MHAANLLLRGSGQGRQVPRRLPQILRVSTRTYHPRQVRQHTSQNRSSGSDTSSTPKSPLQGARWASSWRPWAPAIAVVLVAGGYYLTMKQHSETGDDSTSRQRLVILGSGWGAVSVIQGLNTRKFEITVVSPRDYFLFTPLLPSCTTGLINERSLMESIYSFFPGTKNSIRYHQAAATEIDPKRKIIVTKDPSSGRCSEIPFDQLVVAVGAETASFGIPGVQQHACFLKEVEDARMIRRRVVDCIQNAMRHAKGSDERRRLLNMIVVGGGPTGVEFAAELQDLFDQDLVQLFPEVKDDLRVSLIEALPNVLPMFSQKLIDFTRSSFEKQEINVRTKTMVTEVGKESLKVKVTNPDGSKSLEEIPFGLLVWAAGITCNSLIRNLMNKIPEQRDSRRGLAIDDNLVVNGTKDIWALGDCAASCNPPTAQVAHQQGAYLARVLNALDQNSACAITGPFVFQSQGALAYIGDDEAVADIKWLGKTFASGGPLTGLFWRGAYVSMCLSGRNRLLILADWVSAKFFGRPFASEK